MLKSFFSRLFWDSCSLHGNAGVVFILAKRGVQSELLKLFDSRLSSWILTRRKLKPEQRLKAAPKTAPWTGLDLPERLNSQMEEVVDLIVADYVHRWYKGNISMDNMFLLEIKYQVRYGAATAFRALKDYDFVQLLRQDIIPKLVRHILRVKRGIRVRRPDKEVENYLRYVSDLLVINLLDESRIGGCEMDAEAPTGTKKAWPSETCRHLLREILLSTVIRPLVDFITEPSNLNQLVISLCSSNNTKLHLEDDTRVPILCHLGEYSLLDTPDSLLALNLTDLQKDRHLMEGFRGYMQDARGPMHWLDCFESVQTLLNDCRDSDEFDENIAKNALLLMNDYTNKSSPTYVDLVDDRLHTRLQNSITTSNQRELSEVLESLFRKLYQELNYSFTVPFCQSEAFLSRLCGTSPDALDFSADSPTNEIVFDSVDKSTNGFNDDVDDSVKALEAIDASFLDLSDVFLDHSEDLNSWSVTLSGIEPRRHPRSGRVYYVYKLDVARRMSPVPLEKGHDPLTALLDSDDDEEDEGGRFGEEDEASRGLNNNNNNADDLPARWSIARTYDEFYVFDQRLRHFHRRLERLALLPDRKMFCPRSRAFLEAQLDHVERYLLHLLRQPALRHSQLLAAFLTNLSAAGFDTPAEPDRQQRAAAASARRRLTEPFDSDKRHYLQPFLSRMLARSLAGDAAVKRALTETPSVVSFKTSETSENETEICDTQPYDIDEVDTPDSEDNLKEMDLALMTSALCTQLTNQQSLLGALLNSFARLLPASAQSASLLLLDVLVAKTLSETTAFHLTSAVRSVIVEQARRDNGFERQSRPVTASEARCALRNASHRSRLGRALWPTLGPLLDCFQEPTDNKQLALLACNVLVDKMA